MAHGHCRRQVAIVLMLGVTILVGGSTSQGQGNIKTVRRFLAVDNISGRSLLTVVADARTSVADQVQLSAGTQVRIYGVRAGRTIHAQRIDILE